MFVNLCISKLSFISSFSHFGHNVSKIEIARTKSLFISLFSDIDFNTAIAVILSLSALTVAIVNSFQVNADNISSPFSNACWHTADLSECSQ